MHKYGNIARTINVHSVRKSILSVLMGIYSDRGQINVMKTLAELKIDDKDNLSTIEKQATVQQLLQARSGIYHLAAYETKEMAVLRQPRGSFKPGERWYYNNWDFNALGTIFNKFTDKTVFEALRDDLAKPLMFEDFSYSFDTNFHYDSISIHPAYVIHLSARDLARVGLLMARNGRWGNRQIVSEKWVTESTKSYSETDRPGIGYGYLWWIGTDRMHFQTRFPGKVYSARGYQGQYMIVDPVRDLVIVHLVDSRSGSRRNVSSKQFGELLKRILQAKTEGVK